MMTDNKRIVKRKPFIDRILSDDINPFKFSIAVFIFVFVSRILFELFVGVSMGRFYLGDSNLGEKLEISEIPGRLPFYLAFSSTVAIMIFVILNESQKTKNRK